MFGAISTLLRGRWQMPLAVLATGAAAVALIRLTPAKRPIAYEAIRASLEELKNAGGALDAADAAANLLTLDPPPPKTTQIELHRFIAQILHEQLSQSKNPSKPNAEKLLHHLDSAVALGHRRSAQDTLQIADALRWIGDAADAADGYRSLVAQDVPTGVRRAALRRLIDLLTATQSNSEERRNRLDQLLADRGLPIPDAWRALQEAMRIALDQHEANRARALLDENRERFGGVELRGFLDYLDALVMVHEGRTTEAAPLIPWIDEWAVRTAPKFELDAQFGHLPAMTRWLLGRIALEMGEHADALAHFDAGIGLQPVGRMYFTIAASRAQAQAALGRHAAALGELRETARRIERGEEGAESRREFRETLPELAALARKQEAWNDIAPYLEYALELTPAEDSNARLPLLQGLVAAYQSAAERTQDDLKRQRELLARAGETLAKAAQLAVFDEERHGALLWAAAETLDRAGRMATLQRTLRHFIDTRSEDPRLASALLRLGLAHEAVGEFDTATNLYLELIARFPRLEEASNARLRLAAAYLAIGRERAADAERELQAILGDDYITPDAKVFREALLGLAELWLDQGRFSESISRFEDFLERYPDDDDRVRVRFELANALRESGFELVREGGAPGARQNAADEGALRLRDAAERFRALRAEFGELQDVDAETALFRRLTLFYEADCLAALREPEAQAAAIARYRQAAVEYEQTPAALTALLQLANLHLRQGEVLPAARSLERCRWVLSAIPNDAFAQADDGMTRADWDRYLQTLSNAHLFKNVFNAQ